MESVWNEWSGCSSMLDLLGIMAAGSTEEDRVKSLFIFNAEWIFLGSFFMPCH